MGSGFAVEMHVGICETKKEMDGRACFDRIEK